MEFYVVTRSEKLDLPIAFCKYDTDKITEVEALSREQDRIENLDRDFLTNVLVVVSGDCKPQVVSKEEYEASIERIKEVAIKSNQNALTFS